jgi:hypothetical protein
MRVKGHCARTFLRHACLAASHPPHRLRRHTDSNTTHHPNTAKKNTTCTGQYRIYCIVCKKARRQVKGQQARESTKKKKKKKSIPALQSSTHRSSAPGRTAVGRRSPAGGAPGGGIDAPGRMCSFGCGEAKVPLARFSSPSRSASIKKKNKNEKTGKIKIKKSKKRMVFRTQFKTGMRAAVELQTK